jgi:hypothetical protein
MLRAVGLEVERRCARGNGGARKQAHEESRASTRTLHPDFRALTMDDKCFVLVLMVSLSATLGLTLWKLLGRASYSYSREDGTGWSGGIQQTFIGKLSWFAVPWPVFIGLVALGWPYVWAVLRYEVYKGL